MIEHIRVGWFVMVLRALGTIYFYGRRNQGQGHRVIIASFLKIIFFVNDGQEICFCHIWVLTKHTRELVKGKPNHDDTFDEKVEVYVIYDRIYQKIFTSNPPPLLPRKKSPNNGKNGRKKCQKFVRKKLISGFGPAGAGKRPNFNYFLVTIRRGWGLSGTVEIGH